ncbi:MAG: hypothetical protein JJ902_05160 [Roseibium sp.]|nr:hypothetical protein [Roseibium sp.]
MAYAHIDYGSAKAEFWGPFSMADVESQFYRHANQCFGIRKSIMSFELTKFEPDTGLPAPWSKFEGATVLLKHGMDVIVWGADGEKIKSEWD